MLKNGIEAIIKPVLIIKPDRVSFLPGGTVFIFSGVLNQLIILMDIQRSNLTKSSKRTKEARIIFGIMKIISMAKPYVLIYIFQLRQSVNCVKAINPKQKPDISQ